MDEAVEMVPLGEGVERLSGGIGLKRASPQSPCKNGRHAHAFHQVR